MPPVRIVHLASEAQPWASTGGLSEVSSALSAAQHEQGHDVWLWIPAYRRAKTEAAQRGLELIDTGIGGQVRFPVGVWQWRALTVKEMDGTAQRPVGFIECDPLFDREGLYDDAQHRAFGDNALRFAVFTRAVLQAAPQLMGAAPHILHAHDWQTALGPYWLAEDPSITGWSGCKSVFTIHNLGYPGRFPAHVTTELGLGHFDPEGLEFYGDLALMKAGIRWADLITTVSPTYAREIRTPDHGEGLDGLLRHNSDKLVGVINGIGAGWNPATDPHLPATYDANDLAGKTACRTALLREMGLQADETQPVFASISRFAHQKGLDLLADVAPEIVRADGRLVVLGSGDPALQDRFLALQARFPHHVAVRIGYHVGLSHRIEAGADAFIMPSRYEPCGLNQMYSMAYGTPPIVHQTGGLADTVRHCGGPSDTAATGVVFQHANTEGLSWAVRHATHLFRHHPDAWSRMQQIGMRTDWRWSASAERYGALYDTLMA
ncbi:MAG: glycogen synthase GlgA [Myxococcales bacterium]|nr:glycogen synthase GlgA [Myxococcales bacterium]